MVTAEWGHIRPVATSLWTLPHIYCAAENSDVKGGSVSSSGPQPGFSGHWVFVLVSKTLCPSTLLRISDSVILDCQIITFNTHNRLKMHSALEPNGRLQSFIDLRFLGGYFCLHPVFFMITVSVCCEIPLPPGIIRIRTYCFSHYVKNGNMIK